MDYENKYKELLVKIELLKNSFQKKEATQDARIGFCKEHNFNLQLNVENALAMVFCEIKCELQEIIDTAKRGEVKC